MIIDTLPLSDFFQLILIVLRSDLSNRILIKSSVVKQALHYLDAGKQVLDPDGSNI